MGLAAQAWPRPWFSSIATPWHQPTTPYATHSSATHRPERCSDWPIGHSWEQRWPLPPSSKGAARQRGVACARLPDATMSSGGQTQRPARRGAGPCGDPESAGLAIGEPSHGVAKRLVDRARRISELRAGTSMREVRRTLQRAQAVAREQRRGPTDPVVLLGEWRGQLGKPQGPQPWRPHPHLQRQDLRRQPARRANPARPVRRHHHRGLRHRRRPDRLRPPPRPRPGRHRRR